VGRWVKATQSAPFFYLQRHLLFKISLFDPRIKKDRWVDGSRQLNQRHLLFKISLFDPRIKKTGGSVGQGNSISTIFHHQIFSVFRAQKLLISIMIAVFLIYNLTNVKSLYLFLVFKVKLKLNFLLKKQTTSLYCSVFGSSENKYLFIDRI